MKRKGVTKKLVSIGVSLSMLFAFVVPAIPVSAETTKKATSSTADDILGVDTKKPDGFDAYEKTGLNPYGFEEDEVGRLVTRNELAITKTADMSYGSKTVTTSVLDNFISSKKDSSGFINLKDAFTSSKAKDTRALNFMEGTSVMNKKTARLDTCFYTGVDSQGYVSYWTQSIGDSGRGTASDTKAVDSVPIFTDSCPSYSAANYLAVTSGDYNRDGSGTVIMGYTTKTGVQLKEYAVNSDLTASEKSSYKINNYSLKDEDELTDYMCINLTTGDFNGDRIDDLAYIYYYGWRKDKDARTSKCTPSMGVVYGQKGKNILDCVTGSTTMVTSSDQMTTVVSPGISAGDTDADGKDEIVVGGCKCYYVSKDPDYPYYDYNSMMIGCYKANNTKTPTKISLKEYEANKWTRTAYYSGDYLWAPTAVQCVAINGKGKEHVFVSGTLYESINDGSFNAKYTPEYFNESDAGAGHTAVSNVFISSTTAGVFDGNGYAREQVAFIVALKSSGAREYTYMAGMYGGKDYGDKENPEGGELLGQAQKFYSNNINSGSLDYDVDHGSALMRDMTNCLVIATDVDDDGIIGKYEGMGYSYADPNPTAVLQAAPRFDDIGQDAGETTYSFETASTRETGNGHDTAVSAGAKLETESSVGLCTETYTELGYSGEWTQEWFETVENSYATSFSAAEEDTVIIQRTPIYSFTYQVVPKTKDLQTMNEVNKKGTNILQYTVPQAPVYYQLSIDEYNQFTEEYNAKIDKNNENKKENDPDYIPDSVKLQPITGDSAQYLTDNEGDPSKYRTNFGEEDESESVTKSPIALGYNGGSAGSEKSTSSGTGKETTSSNGFHSYFSAVFGFGFLGNGAKAGGYINIDYGYTSRTTTTTMRGDTTSGSVSNINEKALMEQGYNADTIRGHAFNWRFGLWKIHLGGKSTEKTPVLGYAVSELKETPQPPMNLTAGTTGSDTVHLQWEPAESGVQCDGYNVFEKDEDGNYTLINESPISDTEYDVKNLSSNKAHVFVVTATKDLEFYEPALESKKTYRNSVWSNEAKAKTDKQKCVITYKDPHATTDFSLTHGNKIPIANEESVYEDTIVTVDMSAHDGYVLDNLSIQSGSKEPSVINLAGKKDSYSFVLEADTKIIVNTKDIIEDMDVNFTYGVAADSEGIKHGQITASVEDVEISRPGGKLKSDNVQLKVVPDEGYVLKAWKIDGEDVSAINETSLKYYFTSDKHDIQAVFAKKDDPSVLKKLHFTSSKGGSFLITDEDGKELKPDENGDVSVVMNSEISVEAKPDKYYLFRRWQDDFERFSNSKKATLTVTNEMTVSANFYVPIQYTLDYSSNDESYGTISASTDQGTIDSGAYLIPGTKVDFEFAPKNGYKLRKLEIISGGVAKEVSADDLTRKDDKYEYKLEVDEHEIVKAYFEKYYILRVQGFDSGITLLEEHYLGDEVSLKETGTQSAYDFTGWESVNPEDLNITNASSREASFTMPDQDVLIQQQWSPHRHVYEEKWSNNSKVHWHASACVHDYISEYGIHRASGWSIVSDPTNLKEGLMQRRCDTCGYVMEEKIIPKVAMLNSKTLSQAKTTNGFVVKSKAYKYKVKLTWNKVSGATGYDVFGAKKGKKMKCLKTIKGRSPKTWTQKYPKKSTAYKYYVKAYKIKNGKKKYLKKTKTISVKITSKK